MSRLPFYVGVGVLCGVCYCAPDSWSPGPHVPLGAVVIEAFLRFPLVCGAAVMGGTAGYYVWSGEQLVLMLAGWNA